MGKLASKPSVDTSFTYYDSGVRGGAIKDFEPESPHNITLITKVSLRITEALPNS